MYANKPCSSTNNSVGTLLSRSLVNAGQSLKSWTSTLLKREATLQTLPVMHAFFYFFLIVFTPLQQVITDYYKHHESTRINTNGKLVPVKIKTQSIPPITRRRRSILPPRIRHRYINLGILPRDWTYPDESIDRVFGE